MYLVLRPSPICYITYKYYYISFMKRTKKYRLLIISIIFLIIKISLFLDTINRGTSYAK